MKEFLFFIYEKYFQITKDFIQEKINGLNNFYKGLYSEYLTSRYTFHPGRRIITPKRRRRRVLVRAAPAPDPFDTDKKNLLEETEKFYIILGTFINKYSGDNVHWDWNDYIWQPHREIKSLVDHVSLQRLPILPPPPPVPSSPTVSETPTPVRRARRRFKQYPDTPASCDEERCKVCMTNKKIICFMPCGHIGMCNSCCATLYKKRFMTSLDLPKPYICDTLPLPPKINLNYENEESFIDSIIDELTQPRYHHSKNCIFCKEKIKKMQLIFSV